MRCTQFTVKYVSCSWLEFNVPFQHKYGYIRDDMKYVKLEMWANAQRDGRPAEYRWRPLFNAAKFG